MTAKILKFRSSNIESHPVPNNVEEAKKMVEEHFKTDSFNILLLLDNKPDLPPNPTVKQRITRYWPFQNRWQLMGVTIAIVGHIALWGFTWWRYHN